jgi:hypothetical protein
LDKWLKHPAPTFVEVMVTILINVVIVI